MPIPQTIPHMYGNQVVCEEMFCDKAGVAKQDNLFSRASGEQTAQIMRIVGRFSAKSESLLEDTTSNLAEMYMHHLVAKFTGTIILLCETAIILGDIANQSFRTWNNN